MSRSRAAVFCSPGAKDGLAKKKNKQLRLLKGGEEGRFKTFVRLPG